MHDTLTELNDFSLKLTTHIWKHVFKKITLITELEKSNAWVVTLRKVSLHFATLLLKDSEWQLGWPSLAF